MKVKTKNNRRKGLGGREKRIEEGKDPYEK